MRSMDAQGSLRASNADVDKSELLNAWHQAKGDEAKPPEGPPTFRNAKAYWRPHHDNHCRSTEAVLVYTRASLE
jgi:hypothetical protein